jgi:predicted metal-dependent peptidase
VVVDTSGSVDDNQIEQFFTEILAIYKNGTYVEIVECDAEFKRNYRYKGRTPNFVMGRGGTDFDPAFKWIRDSGLNFDGCIYLTDGYADSPKIRPGCRVLWVISGGEGGDHLTFGRQLMMDN